MMPKLPWCPECQQEADYNMHPIYFGNRVPPPGSNERPVDWNARCTVCLSSVEWLPYYDVPIEKRLRESRHVRMPDEPEDD